MISHVVTSVFTVPPASPIGSAPLGVGGSGVVAAGSDAARQAWIAGPENALVQVAVNVILSIDDQRRWMNPLVICGTSGTGKTALVQVLVDEKHRQQKTAVVLHEVAVDFARAYAHAVDTDSIADFRSKHTRCDLLVLDDLQRLAGKPAAQQELVAIIDALIRRGAMILFTLKQLPTASRGLLPMLVSRISQGLVVPLAVPGVEARDTLLRIIAAQQGLLLPEELAEQLSMAIAARPAGSLTAPQLKHLVIELARWHHDRVLAAEGVSNLPSSLQIAPSAEASQIRRPRSRTAKLPTPAPVPRAENAADFIAQLLRLRTPDLKTALRLVTQLVAKHYQLSPADLRGQSRQQSLVQGRSVAMYIARTLTEASFADVGKYFGNRDHTTVLHAVRKIQSQLEKDTPLKQLVDEISQACLLAEARPA